MSTSSRTAWGTTSTTASRHSTQPADEPGVLSTRVVPRVPATPRESRPSGLTRRIASARPGASLSSTDRVPSGVRSRGPKPVPPVVTMRPWNPSARLRRASATSSTPSAQTARPASVQPSAATLSASAAPDRSSRVPWTTPSETVRTFTFMNTCIDSPSMDRRVPGRPRPAETDAR